ncbi:MAG: signal peptide peptidase SppA [Actinobacteria bacterium]|nr:signal peptide peptidase SppA [Actinomycetota bacterium]
MRGGYLIVGAICMGLACSSMAQESLLYQSLKRSYGTTSMAMGAAYTAVAEGTNAAFYNPAGLVSPALLYSYQNSERQYDPQIKSLSHSLLVNPFQLSVLDMSHQDGERVSVKMLSMGIQGGNGLDYGINYKFTDEYQLTKVMSFQSADLGIKAQLIPELSLGVMIRDIYRKELSLPTTYSAGMSFLTPSHRVRYAADLHYQRVSGQSQYEAHFGLDAALSEGVSLQLGWHDDRVSAGMAIFTGLFRFEYGMLMSPFQDESHLYRFGIRLGRYQNLYTKNHQYSLFKPKSLASFVIDESLVEGRSEVSLLGGKKLGTNDLLHMIRLSSLDPYCEGYLIRLGSFSSSLTSLGVIQEIRDQLQYAQSKGKRVYIYVDNWVGFSGYYLAAIADRIYMSELGMVSQMGLDLSILRAKSVLEQFGVSQVNVVHGAFKDVLNPMTEKINESERFHLETLMDELYLKSLAQIRMDRPQIDWDQLLDVLDGRMVTAKKAKALGMVDELVYWQDIVNRLQIENQKVGLLQTQITPLSQFVPAPSPYLMRVFNRIAVIEIDGKIGLGGSSGNFLFGGKMSGVSDLERQVRRIISDPRIRGVVVRINSGGGSMLASDQIYRLILRLKKSGKLVYASMGNVAASGAYYVALATDKIWVNPSSLTGSIGVISSYYNFSELQKMLGFSLDVIKTGRYMDLGASNRPVSDTDYHLLKRFQTFYYDVFIDRLIRHRGYTEEEAYDVAQGQLFTGEAASKINLVDELGGFYDAIDHMAKALGIESPELIFVRPSERLRLGKIGKMGFSTMFNVMGVPEQGLRRYFKDFM